MSERCSYLALRWTRPTCDVWATESERKRKSEGKRTGENEKGRSDGSDQCCRVSMLMTREEGKVDELAAEVDHCEDKGSAEAPLFGCERSERCDAKTYAALWL